MAKLKYKRILLKLSGEVFKGKLSGGVDGEVLMNFAKRIKNLQKMGCEIGIVVGGGNIWRFRDFKDLKLNRVTSDTIGMMATMINSLALEAALNAVGAQVRAMTNLPCDRAMEPYIAKRARTHMGKGKIVIFAGGTGNPFFTTDSAAALKTLEMGCDILIKATKVDCVCDKDPTKFKNVKKYENLTFNQVIEKDLKVMDLACASLCKEGHLKMLVVNLNDKTSIERAVKGQKVGTLIQ